MMSRIPQCWWRSPLGDQRLPVEGDADTTVELLAVRGGTNLTLLVNNHNILGADIFTEDVSITLKNDAPGTAAAITRIDGESANPKQKWIELGSPQ